MDEHLNTFLRVLDPQDNQTGGGAASAIAGAMAAALVGMVARLSIGKQGLEAEAYYRPIDQQAQALAEALLSGANADSQAFDAVMDAYRAPKDTPAQKARRSQAIQQALIAATHVPLNNAENCARIMSLCSRLEGRSNPNAASDLDCARYLARAGLRGCLSNVRANLTAIKDPQTIRQMTAQLERLQAEAVRQTPA